MMELGLHWALPVGLAVLGFVFALNIVLRRKDGSDD